MGIDENRLYFNDKIDFINNNPHIKSQSKRFQGRCFFNKEINRNKLIKKSQSERNIIMMNEKNNFNHPYTPNISANFYHKNNESRQYYSNYIDKNKSITDYWKLRYDVDKENERFYLIQKQNLSEVKNLIDLTVKLYNKARHNNYDDYIKREEEKNKAKCEYQKKRDKEYLNKEKTDKERDLIDKQIQEKEFRKEYLNQRKIDEKKEKEIIDEQNKLMKKQKDWELQNFEHMTKVANIYQQKHNNVINEYFDILKKDRKRNKRFEIIKEDFDYKNRIENQKREVYLVNFKKKKKDIENDMIKKYEKRHKHISAFAEEQKEIKNNIIKNRRKELDEKIEKNFFLKQLYEEMKNERRDRLLEQFEINEEKVEKRKNLKEKKNEEVKFNNYMKHDAISANYLEQKNILNYKNMIKMKNMKNKNLEIEEKKKRRQMSAKLKMDRDNVLKYKKQQMIKDVNKILDERKEHNIEDVYKRIFTNEEINLLKENEKQI